ncbi:hypothetical protein V5O48_018947, partial [Marasmius crinis-equi]
EEVELTAQRALDYQQSLTHRSRQEYRGEQEDKEEVSFKDLWLVRCKPYQEWEVLVYAINHANARNTTAITSLHYRNDGDGLIYLDTSHPSEAAQILAKNPSIRRSRDSSYCGIDMCRLKKLSDSKNSLVFHQEPITRGSWVRVTSARFKGRHRPVYDGDLGLVTDMDFVDGSTQVALVCRTDDSPAASKGEHSQSFLQGPDKHSRFLISEDRWPNHDELAAAGISVDHGLRLEWVPKGTAVSIREPPSALDMGLFISSGHPLVLESFPHVKEWVFTEGEMVESWSGNLRGKIRVVSDAGVEIVTEEAVSNSSTMHSSAVDECFFLGWAVKKCWRVGDYVQHTRGRKGLVLGFDNDIVYFWTGGEEKGEEEDEEQSEPSVSRNIRVMAYTGLTFSLQDVPYAGHRNALRSLPRVSQVDALLARRAENASMEWLKFHGMSEVTIERTMSDLNASRASDSDPLLFTPRQIDHGLAVSKTFSSPWKWWEVIVWRGAQRGYHRVFDVLVGQRTKSGLKVQVQSTVVNALGTIFAVDYDDVVDAELLLPLHYIRSPPEAFKPPRDYCHPGIQGLGKQRSKLRIGERKQSPELQEPPRQSPERQATPPPAPAPSSEDPAWDPGAPPPQELAISTPQPRPQPEWWQSHHISQHELYELQGNGLAGVLFQVKLLGSIELSSRKTRTYDANSSTQSIFFDSTGGTRRLTISWNRVKGAVPAEMVIKPQRPASKTGLPMVVTKGEHKGLIATKVTGDLTNLWVFPTNAFTGTVDTKADSVLVSGLDCCSVRLKGDAHAAWQKFEAYDWLKNRHS